MPTLEYQNSVKITHIHKLRKNAEKNEEKQAKKNKKKENP